MQCVKEQALAKFFIERLSGTHGEQRLRGLGETDGFHSCSRGNGLPENKIFSK